jgi:zinc protease
VLSLTARRTLFAALVLALAQPSLARAQDSLPPAGEIIDRYVAAIGGRDLVLSKEGNRATGQFAMPAAGIEGTMEMIATGSPTRVKMQVVIPGLGEILNGYTGEVGWSVDPNMGTRLLDGLELAAMVEGASPEGSIRDPSMFEVRETVERTELNGQECYRVRLVWKSSRETFDCYSVETGLLVGTTATQETPMGDVEAVTIMEDYQEVEGILTPMRMTQQVLGQEQLFTLDSVEYTAIDPAEFEPPAAIQTLIDRQGAEDGQETDAGGL